MPPLGPNSDIRPRYPEQDPELIRKLSALRNQLFSAVRTVVPETKPALFIAKREKTAVAVYGAEGQPDYRCTRAWLERLNSSSEEIELHFEEVEKVGQKWVPRIGTEQQLTILNGGELFVCGPNGYYIYDLEQKIELTQNVLETVNLIVEASELAAAKGA